MEIPNQALGVSHEVLTVVTHGIDSLVPLEQPGETAPLGHTCKDYIRECVHNGSGAVCLTLPNGFVEGWHEGPEGHVVHEPFYDASENGPPLFI